MNRRKTFFIVTILTLSLALAVSIIVVAQVARPGKHYPGSIKWQGRDRTYLVYLPDRKPEESVVPMVLVLHGGGGTGRGMIRLTRMGFEKLADRDGFIVVYPDAVEKRWNDGRGIQRYKAHREGVDDVGFLSALIDRMVKEHRVDPRRVYSTGASNGALMSYRLALEAPRKISAIGPVISSMGEEIASKKKPSLPMPVIIINGTEDPMVPYGGGEIGIKKIRLGRVMSTPATAEFWAKHNGCSFPPDVTRMPDKDPADGTTLEKYEYTGGKDGSEVVLYKIIGGGHTWPGGKQYLPEKIIGRTSREIDGCRTIWEFFKKHSR